MSSAMAMLSAVRDAQHLRGPEVKDASCFIQNLERVLDKRRSKNRLLTLRMPRDAVDFSSSDFLSLSSSGLIRKAFFDEVGRYPEFHLGSSGSRLLDGTNQYMVDLEQELADFHGGETGLFFNSGYDANGAIFTVLPQPGDVIVYDELCHASIHDGMRTSRCSVRHQFQHNNLKSFAETLEAVRNSEKQIENGERSVLISIESVYSMDGDIAPIEEMVKIAKATFPHQNAQFIIDEAHSTGLIGSQGRGLVSEYGLEKDFAVRLHTFGKALGSSGAIVIANQAVKNMLINYARCLIYSTAPSFPALAAVRGGYNLLKSGETMVRQNRLQDLLRFFYQKINLSPTWEPAKAAGILKIPTGHNWENQRILTHVVPLITRQDENHLLIVVLHLDDYCAWPIDYPVVPKGEGRVRLVFHSNNTEEQIIHLVEIIMSWAQELLNLESQHEGAVRVEEFGTHLQKPQTMPEDVLNEKIAEIECEAAAANTIDEKVAEIQLEAATAGTIDEKGAGNEHQSTTPDIMDEKMAEMGYEAAKADVEVRASAVVSA